MTSLRSFFFKRFTELFAMTLLVGASVDGREAFDDGMELKQWLSKLPDVSCSFTKPGEYGASCLVGSMELIKNGRRSAYVVSLEWTGTEEEGVQQDGEVLTYYSVTGRSFLFPEQQATMVARLWGPDSNRTPDLTSSFRESLLHVNQSNLSLGLHRLDNFFAAVDRYREKWGDDAPFRYNWRQEPFPSESLLPHAESLVEIGLDGDTERAFVGAVPALLEFFELIRATDGLNDIFMEMIPRRRFLGMLNPLSERSVGFSFGQPLPYRIPAGVWLSETDTIGVMPVVFSMNGRPVLRLTLFTTDPSGDWLVSAGVVAMHVRSIADPETQLGLRFTAR